MARKERKSKPNDSRVFQWVPFLNEGKFRKFYETVNKSGLILGDLTDCLDSEPERSEIRVITRKKPYNLEFGAIRDLNYGKNVPPCYVLKVFEKAPCNSPGAIWGHEKIRDTYESVTGRQISWA